MASTGKILVTGCRGQLGHDLMDILADTHEVVGVDIDKLDIRSRQDVLHYVRETRPNIVIHAAAYTDVDACETDLESANDVNVGGTENVALACADVGARMIYYSTDYVFNGQKTSAYTEGDPINPISVYGLTKLGGEDKIKETLNDYAILRVAWVYGLHGKNFVKTMIRLAREQVHSRQQDEPFEPLKVVNDRIGNPTWTIDIAHQTVRVIQKNLTGTYHATSEGETSWYGFARAVFEDLSLEVDLVPCTTAEFPRPAPRPAMSSLENRRLKALGANLMRHWRTALADFLQRNRGELLA